MTAGYCGGLELTWTNKDKALLSTGDGKYDYTFVDRDDYRVSEVRLLHEIERVEAPAPEGRPEGLPEPPTENLLITGDAMHALDTLNKVPEYSERYLGKVKLVYIDPPFNTGRRSLTTTTTSSIRSGSRCPATGCGRSSRRQLRRRRARITASTADTAGKSQVWPRENPRCAGQGNTGSRWGGKTPVTAVSSPVTTCSSRPTVTATSTITALAARAILAVTQPSCAGVAFWLTTSAICRAA